MIINIFQIHHHHHQTDVYLFLWLLPKAAGINMENVKSSLSFPVIAATGNRTWMLFTDSFHIRIVQTSLRPSDTLGVIKWLCVFKPSDSKHCNVDAVMTHERHKPQPLQTRAQLLRVFMCFSAWLINCRDTEPFFGTVRHVSINSYSSFLHRLQPPLASCSLFKLGYHIVLRRYYCTTPCVKVVFDF